MRNIRFLQGWRRCQKITVAEERFHTSNQIVYHVKEERAIVHVRGELYAFKYVVC
jgi:hypothetical protein